MIAAVSVNLIAAADIDLTSPAIYVSADAREAIASGTANTLSCLELPKRSRKFRVACVTAEEWQKAAGYAAVTERNIRHDQNALFAQNFASERYSEDRFSLLPR